MRSVLIRWAHCEPLTDRGSGAFAAQQLARPGAGWCAGQRDVVLFSQVGYRPPARKVTVATAAAAFAMQK